MRYFNRLGVVFSSDLSFVDQIDSFVQMGLKKLNFVQKRTKLISDMRTLKYLYYSLVRSFLEYNQYIDDIGTN